MTPRFAKFEFEKQYPGSCFSYVISIKTVYLARSEFQLFEHLKHIWTDRFVAKKPIVLHSLHTTINFSVFVCIIGDKWKKNSKSQSIEMACVSAIKQRTFSYQRSIRQFLIFEGLSQNSFFLQSLFILVVFHRNGKNRQTWKTLNNHSDKWINEDQNNFLFTFSYLRLIDFFIVSK